MKTMLRLLVVLACTGLAATAPAANLGPDDQRISSTGSDGDPQNDAFAPAVAFNSSDQTYLSVWSADAFDGEFHIWGRLLSGASGSPLGEPFLISPGLGGTADHLQPAVAYSPQENRFLVVWSSDRIDAGAFEIVGRLVGADGALDPNLHRYSDAGDLEEDTTRDAITPDVAWDPGQNGWVVVWAADDNGVDLLDGRFEIYGQLVQPDGFPTGANDFRISYSLTGPTQNDVLEPTLAVDPDSERWFVAFEADINDDGIHDPEIWMYGVTGDLPDPAASNISTMGADWFDGLAGRHPDLAYVPGAGELVCVWSGEPGGGLEPAVYAQRINLDGTLIGSRIGISAGAGTAYGDLREAIHPRISIDPNTDEWFVVWQGDLDDGVDGHDYEIWNRSFGSSGTPLTAAAVQLSAMDPGLDPAAGAGPPAVATNATHGYRLVLWSGAPDTAPGEREIYAQAWAADGASPVGDAPASAFALHGAYPNPFNPQTTIAFDLPRAQAVTLEIYDAAGRRVRTLLDGEPGRAGRNEVLWNGTDDTGRSAASGVYLYRLRAAGRTETSRMVLLK